MEMKNKFAAANRAEWTAWLAENYASESEVWLVYFKKHTGKASIGYNESVEEALCYGWIDSIIQKIDEEQYARKFTPRRPGSDWSAVNKKRVKKLIKEGRMLEAGMALVDFDPDAPIEEKQEPQLSADLLAELKGHETAWANFEKLSPSHRRRYVGWIIDAEKPETRQRRLTEAIEKLAAGEVLGLK